MEPKSTERRLLQPSWTRVILLFVLAYEGLGGIAGGALLVAEPSGSLMDMPVELMRGVFDNFRIPGLILLAMGVLSTYAFIPVYRRKQSDWVWSCMALCGWYIWFVTEIIILNELHWLHLMWGVPVLLGMLTAIPLVAARNNTPAMQSGLLVCGILSSLWYTAMNLVVPMHDPGYSVFAFTVSELSAIGAPTRILWVLPGTLYPLLYAAFGWGIWMMAGTNRALKTLAGIIIAYSVLNLYWPPMHTREAIAAGAKSSNDTLHMIWAMATVALFLCTMIFGARCFGKNFWIYTVISMVLLIVFGMLTSSDVPNMEANLPTPWMGLWERINQYLFFLWVIVLSFLLLKRTRSQAP